MRDDSLEMSTADVVNRLASLPRLAELPRTELEWLAAHGRLESHTAGTVIAPKGRRIETLWIVLSGKVAIRVDRGVGPRLVTEWLPGDVTGMLPYSRMTGPPGDNYLESPGDLLAIPETLFSEMIHRCPRFTAQTVHSMLDRARSFNTSDLQIEKMVSLGKLAAGLAHELNNPASATARGATLLLTSLDSTDAASRALGAAGLSDELMHALERTRSACLVGPSDGVLSPIEQADREDEIDAWLARRHSNVALAGPLADTSVTLQTLDELAERLPAPALDAALQWLAASCTTHSLSKDIERAATRIYELVSAIKRFTYMDRLTGSESADVEDGLRDTVRVLAAKAKAKGIAITLDIAPKLPRAHGVGSDLNQVWFNLVDNALDAISGSGQIDVRAHADRDQVTVTIVDDGPGIPAEILPNVFDPFFTTKPPGQGTGLGLEIVRQLVRRYHGDVSVRSRPGCTEFCVTLRAEQQSTDKATAGEEHRPG